MSWPVYARALRLQRRALVGWSVALCAVVLLTLASYPTIRDQAEELQAVLDQMPEAMTAFFGDISDVTSGAGFIRGRLFSLMLPLLFVIYAVGRAADAIAGEEERGALDLPLAHPIPRSSLLLQKAAAIATGVIVLAVAPLALVLGGDALLGLELHAGRLALTMGMLVLHTLAVGGIGFAVGAATGRKAHATSAAVLVAAGGFILEGLANLSTTLEPLQALSTFHHYGGGGTLTTLSGWPGALVLLGVLVVSMTAAVVLFERRDIGRA